MGTTHNFDNPPASAIAAADTFPLIDATTGRGKTGTIAQAISATAAPIGAGATLSATQAAHSNRTVLLDTAGGSTVTLPAATGSGAAFKFLVSVLATTLNHIVKVANTADVIQGMAVMVSTTASATTFFATNATTDTVTLNRSTSGSVTKGEWLEFDDIAANTWAVRGMLTNTGTGVTPFSATV